MYIRKKDPAKEECIVDIYFRSIKKYKLLTGDEEKDLIVRAQNGDGQAWETVITANLRLSVYIAKKYLYRVSHLKMSDLIQAGNEGLVKAVKRFDPAKECRFSTYATFWIRQALDRELGKYEQPIRNPIYVVEGLKRYKKAVHVLTHQLGRRPSAAEVATETGESERWVKVKEDLSKKYVSFDAPVSGSEDSVSVLGDFIVGSDGTEAYTARLRSELREKFAEVFKDSLLNEKEKTVLLLRYGIGSGGGKEFTLDEISVQLCLTRERIRQIEERALRKLKKRIKNLKGMLS